MLVRRLLTALSCMAAVPFQAASAEEPSKWKFIAFVVYENVPGCTNPVDTKAGYIWAKESGSSSRAEAHVWAEIRQGYPRRKIEPTLTMIPGKPHGIWLVQFARECKTHDGKISMVNSLKFFFGATPAAIEAQIARYMASYGELKSHKYLERLDGGEEARKLDQQKEPLVFGRKPD